MGDRYRYSRPRSPTWNPARASLPADMSYGSHHPAIVQHHHVVPLSRYENPRSSGTSFTSSNGPITTTTYKVKPDSRSTSRTRSSTVDSRPDSATIFTAVPRHRPVVHSTVVRPSSPSLKSPYRSSQEDYYAIPASSKNDKSHHHHHRNKYSSASVDNADMNRLSREPRDPSHLRVNSVRDGQAYTSPTSSTSSRPRERATYPATMVRHPDTVADDYGEDGYGYTNPRDLVQYDLMNNSSRRRDSFDASGRSSRPVSITGYGDVASPRSYDNRERGPPPTTRGFDRIQTWEQPQPQVRMPVPHVAPVDPIPRPARMEPPAPFEAEVPKRRASTRRPVSMYHDDREMRQPRDDHYEVRDDDPRDRRSHHKHDRYEDPVEQRGFGLRPERQDRPERPASRAERMDRGERSDRAERSDRGERSDRRERSPRPERERAERGERDMEERREKKSSTHEKVATGLSIASAALGLGAMANSLRPEERDDRDDRDEPRRRKEYDDEQPRRRRDRDDRDEYEAPPREMRERRHRDEDRDSGSDRSDRRDGRERRHRDTERDSAEPSGRDTRERDTRERRHRDDDVPPTPRESRRHEEDEQPRESRHREDASRDIARDGKDRHSPDSAYVDLSGRDPKERPSSSEDRPRHEGATNGATHDSHSETSDEGTNHHRRPRRISGAAAAPFNPRDTMDLRALKEALAGHDAPEQKEPVVVHAASAAQPPPKQPSPEPLAVPSKPIGRQSITKDMREVAELRAELNKEDRGRREPLAPNDNKQIRVVSPPREKPEEKPVKGILRQPREKFPEDPSPIREGVAPLKDAKKDGVPPDARWTKIARKLVNPEALEIGKERYEAREDFVIVLRVLSREEIQAYATATQQIRAAREEEEDRARRRARREGHERRKRERIEHGRSRRHSESDTSEEYDEDRPRMLEAAPGKRSAHADDHVMSGGL